jgi:uncharacterized protein
MKHFSCSLLLLLIAFVSPAQNRSGDLRWIQSHITGEKKNVNSLNTDTPIEVRHRSVVARYNPFTLTASGLMLFYQHIVSPQIAASCIYTRSCSNFAKQSIKEYGLVKGVFLAADRLLRCNRSCENDHPSYAVAADGKIMDEPLLYKKVK